MFKKFLNYLWNPDIENEINDEKIERVVLR